jgi:cellulose synthase/poly-beta-1,6-N-acetylglucosamine synthase-like glycosyltransferase
MTTMSADSVLVLTFWIGGGAALYAYVGFPAIVALLARIKGSGKAHVGGGEAKAPLTVIIPAYNEEDSIEAKIRNVLAAEYPRELLDIVVVSDASTDRTNEIARSFQAQGVRLIVQETRRGKTAGLNRAIEVARGEIVIFTDANALYPVDTIATLARYFARPRVGLVTGYTRYVLSANGEITRATNMYTSLERMLKAGEGRWGGCVGADGAIFAMRRSLYRPLRHDDINDFVIPLGVIDQGYQCVFAADAFCSEAPGKSLESEFRRQARITNRTLRALWRRRRLLNPVRFGLFSFFLFSHKVVRFLVPLLLTLSAASLTLLAGTGAFYLTAGVGALVTVAVAAGGRSRAATALRCAPLRRLFSFVNVFLTINLAVLQGWWSFLRGRTDAVWQHDRSGG